MSGAKFLEETGHGDRLVRETDGLPYGLVFATRLIEARRMYTVDPNVVHNA